MDRMLARWILYRSMILLGVAGISGPAAALTGGDVLDKMNADQRGSYVAGTVEMAAFLSGLQGNKTRADCIMDWYYNKGGTSGIVTGFAQYKDRQALPVIYLLIKKACGE